MSDELIELNKFIEFFQVDPHYFEMTFLLRLNNSEKPYALLRKILEKTDLAAIMPECHRSDHLRYKDEVTDPSHFAELKDLPEAGEGGAGPYDEDSLVDKLGENLCKHS
ncbi:MAG: hypothetical protein ABR985_19815 [Methanotrichaceae archaeon]|jgi:hypothetical protein